MLSEELTPLESSSQCCGDTARQALLCRGQVPTWPKAKFLRAQSGTKTESGYFGLRQLPKPSAGHWLKGVLSERIYSFCALCLW